MYPRFRGSCYGREIWAKYYFRVIGINLITVCRWVHDQMVQLERELVRVPLGLGGVDFERSFSWKLGITLLSGKKLVVITCVGVVSFGSSNVFSHGNWNLKCLVGIPEIF